MKTRQFVQLGGVSRPQRDELLVDGLKIIATAIENLKLEFDICAEAGAHRAARLVRNAAVEEAGKFLLLIDHFRDPDATQAEQTKHFRRAGNHLAKLLYAQIADYSIGDRRELQGAVDHHRAGLYLDGPNDFDWIFPNELVSEREGALYTDLQDREGTLQWSEPLDSEFVRHPGQPVELVLMIAQIGLVSSEGFRALEQAWAGFDQTAASTYSDWADRTIRALEILADALGEVPEDEGWQSAAGRVIDLWPMPMTRLDLRMTEQDVSAMQSERDARWKAFLASEYGSPEW